MAAIQATRGRTPHPDHLPTNVDDPADLKPQNCITNDEFQRYFEYNISKDDGTELDWCLLEYALKLLALPRTVGTHPETEEPITADYGRFGPYIRCGKQNASLRGVETPLDITVEKSVELLANKNKRSTELRTIGDHPETGESLVVKDGRFGPYITDGKVNVSLRGDLTPDGIALEQAVELINKKRLAPARPKRKRKKKKK